MKEASVTEIRDYFGYSGTAEFSVDWGKLTPEDKVEFKVGVGKILHPEA